MIVDFKIMLYVFYLVDKIFKKICLSCKELIYLKFPVLGLIYILFDNGKG